MEKKKCLTKLTDLPDGTDYNLINRIDPIYYKIILQVNSKIDYLDFGSIIDQKKRKIL